jgi:hypothetical protein
MKRVLLPIVLLLLLTLSCTSTRIVSSWCEPNKKVTIDQLHKVLVVALFKDKTSNRKAEDQMVSYLNGKGIVSYDYLNDRFDKKNVEVIREKIKKDGFDGAVTMRLIDVEKEKIYNPGEINQYPTEYQSFSGYYYNRWNYNTTPGYYTTTKIYTVETNVYSIAEDKIIWSGLTETTDPEGVKKLTEEVTKVVFKQMVKEGFIAK